MRYGFFRLALFLFIGAFPLYWLYMAWSFALGPDPGKVLLLDLGQGALILLIATLAMTPFKKVTGWSFWLVIRRQLGLWSFGYAVLHLLAYLVFILGLDFSQLSVELMRRPYILVGAVALLLLIPLALTSNSFSMKRLGGRGWRRLHRLIYGAVLLGLLHMLWIVRSDVGLWLLYSVVTLVLLMVRLPLVSQFLFSRKRQLGG